MKKNPDLYGDSIRHGIGVMRRQRAKGIKKYGVTVEEAELSVEELIQHAQEEMADGLVYTARLAAVFARRLEDERSAIIGEVLNILSTGANMDIKEAQIRQLATEVPTWRVMFVQPSVLEDYWRTGANLLTFHRSHAFPFTQPVLVRV